jgi:hypothetical protein
MSEVVQVLSPVWIAAIATAAVAVFGIATYRLYLLERNRREALVTRFGVGMYDLVDRMDATRDVVLEGATKRNVTEVAVAWERLRSEVELARARLDRFADLAGVVPLEAYAHYQVAGATLRLIRFTVEGRRPAHIGDFRAALSRDAVRLQRVRLAAWNAFESTQAHGSKRVREALGAYREQLSAATAEVDRAHPVP